MMPGGLIHRRRDGRPEVEATGLPWRAQVCQQVFEEAAVDFGRGLAAWSASRTGDRKVIGVGFPGFKKKPPATPSFRLRSKHPKAGRRASGSATTAARAR